VGKNLDQKFKGGEEQYLKGEKGVTGKKRGILIRRKENIRTNSIFTR